MRRWRQPWVFSLVRKFLRKPPPLHTSRDFITKTRKVSCPPLVLDPSNDFFLFHFRSEEDAVSVLTSGPRSFPWRPNFNPMFETLKTIPFWIQLHGSPMEFWNREGVLAIMQALGRPRKIDDRSLKMERGRDRSHWARRLSRSVAEHGEEAAAPRPLDQRKPILEGGGDCISGGGQVA